MAALEANATTYQEITTVTAAVVNNADVTAGVRQLDGGEDQRGMIVTDDDEDDELFELDIGLIDHRDGEEYHKRRVISSGCAIVAGGGDDDEGDALLANCLLPVSSVSKAVPVTDSCSFVVVSSYFVGRYHGGVGYDDASSWRRFFFTSGGSRTRIGRHSSNNSARFSFSRFQNMGNFQRY